MSLQLDDLNLLDAPAHHGGGSPLLLPLDTIDEDPSQPRCEFDEASLRELAETIAQRGVKQPVSVRPHPEQSGRWILNFGARRLRASRLAGKTEIPAFIDDTADSYDQVIENEHREGLKPIELALFVKRQLDCGLSQAEIGRRLGKSRQYINYVTAMIEPPDWLMALYRAGRCRGIKELYDLRHLHEAHGNALIEWIGRREFVSRRDIAQFAGLCNESTRDAIHAREDEQHAEQGPRIACAPGSSSHAANGEPRTSRNSPEEATSAVHRLAAPVRRRFVLRANVENAVVDVLLSATPEDGDDVLVALPDGTRQLIAPERIGDLRIERS